MSEPAIDGDAPPPGPAASGAADASAIALRGALLMIAAMTGFATMAICARVAARQMSAPQLVSLRFAISGAAVLALALAGRAELRPRNLRLLGLRGLFGGGAVLLYFVALARCRDAGTATLLNYTSPIFTNAFAWLFLAERPSPRLAAGVGLAALGVALTLWRPEAGLPALGVGELAGLASAVLSGLAVVTIRAARATDNAPTILLAFCVGGLLLSLPFALADWRVADAPTWALAVVMSLASFAGQLGMTHAFGLVPAGRGALFQQLTPVFTFALGALLLDEPVTALAAAGATLTVAAVLAAAGPR